MTARTLLNCIVFKQALKTWLVLAVYVLWSLTVLVIQAYIF